MKKSLRKLRSFLSKKVLLRNFKRILIFFTPVCQMQSMSSKNEVGILTLFGKKMIIGDGQDMSLYLSDKLMLNQLQREKQRKRIMEIREKENPTGVVRFYCGWKDEVEV